MEPETNEIELPRFTRQISLLNGRAENRTPTERVGVLRPFSGLLGSDFERGGWGPLPLSHVVLSATVQQGLRPATDTGTTDRPADQKPSDQSPTTLRVRDLLREGNRERGGQSEPDQESAAAFEHQNSPTTQTETPSSREPRTGERTGGMGEIGLDEFTDELDESASDNDKNMLKNSKEMSKEGEPTSNPDRSKQSDDRGRRDSTDSDSSLAESESSPTDADPSESARGDSDRPRGTDAGRGLDTGDATGRLSRLATLDTPTARRQSATETPTTASRIEVPPTLSPVETPSLASDEGGIDFGSPLTYSTHGRADSSPIGAFQMTYQRPNSVASSSTDRPTEFEDAISQSAAESADSGSEQTDAERGGPVPFGPPRSAEIDLDEIDVSRLVDRVYDEFQRKTRIERERRGL